MGSFETDIAIPDFKTEPMKMSSVVLASQIQPATKHGKINDPLVREGSRRLFRTSPTYSAMDSISIFIMKFTTRARKLPRTAKPKLRVAASGFSPMWLFSRAA